jgi:glucose/arabinose dehydrogenase
MLSVVLLPFVAIGGLQGGSKNPPPPNNSIEIKMVAEGLTSPVAFVQLKGHDHKEDKAHNDKNKEGDRFLIVDQIGLIRVLDHGMLLPDPFLDVRDRMVTLRAAYDERGLLGLALHPDFEENGRFFVYYSAPLRAGAPAGFDHTNVISEFRASKKNPNQADKTSERIILQVDHPQFNHDGGQLAFGPKDGYLYISIGDGGAANDVGPGHVPGGNGQDTKQNLLGNILRIDVDHGQPYAIPKDNPFVGTSSLAEIYAYGFRNPYRFSFDMEGRHALLASDAGQNLWEEVDMVVKGGNYGWSGKEGTHCFSADTPNASPPTCPNMGADGKPFIDPVIEYANARQPGGLGVAGVGGYVYRGESLRGFDGQYIFGDFSRGFVKPDGSLFAAKPQSNGLWQIQQLSVKGSVDGRLGHFVLGFGQDQEGEVYVLVRDLLGPAGATGKVLKLVQSEKH